MYFSNNSQSYPKLSEKKTSLYIFIKKMYLAIFFNLKILTLIPSSYQKPIPLNRMPLNFIYWPPCIHRLYTFSTISREPIDIVCPLKENEFIVHRTTEHRFDFPDLFLSRFTCSESNSSSLLPNFSNCCRRARQL